VRTAINRSPVLKILKVLRNGKNRIRRKIPAVTRVEEWTKAETGVGAAIAAGSQAENGIWALLVIPAINRQAAVIKDRGVSHINKIFQWPWRAVKPIATRSITSPIRLAKAVIIPADKDFMLG
jgi:hypothetical protein